MHIFAHISGNFHERNSKKGTGWLKGILSIKAIANFPECLPEGWGPVTLICVRVPLPPSPQHHKFRQF